MRYGQGPRVVRDLDKVRINSADGLPAKIQGFRAQQGAVVMIDTEGREWVASIPRMNHVLAEATMNRFMQHKTPVAPVSLEGPIGQLHFHVAEAIFEASGVVGMLDYDAGHCDHPAIISPFEMA